MSTNSTLATLLSPIKIGGLTVRNRLVMPPMGIHTNDQDGFVTAQGVAYYEARAKGGTGLVIVEYTCVDCPRGRAARNQLVISDDKYIPGLTKLARAIKRHGASAAIQIHHGGRACDSEVTGVQPVAPSPIPMPVSPFGKPRGGDLPHELNQVEIAEIVCLFAQAARRARQAGFDAVELHAASGYLIAEFLSRASNRRTDEYGGTVAHRARLLLEIIKAIKDEMGQEFPVWPRINGREYGIEDGLTSAEAAEIAQLAQEAGADAIHVSTFLFGLSPRSVPPMSVPAGSLMRLVDAIKPAVTVPVIAVGNLNLVLGEQILREGRADLIAIGKGLIADPELGNKARAGRLDDVVPCISCMNCMGADESVGFHCLINAAAGSESQSTITPVAIPKRVLVIGGGPAGMEAARVAALRGHSVTIWEEHDELGGKLSVAERPPHKSGITILRQYLVTQMARPGITVELGRTGSAEAIVAAGCDAVIIATGSTDLVPRIAGINRANVITAAAVLTGEAEPGAVVTIIGGGVVGLETAEVLVSTGKQVTVIDILPFEDLGKGIPAQAGMLLMSRLQFNGVTFLPSTRVEEVLDGKITVSREGQRLSIEADTVVLATGGRPNTDLFEALRARVPEVYLVGDCLQPRDMLAAIRDAFRIASRLWHDSPYDDRR